MEVKVLAGAKGSSVGAKILFFKKPFYRIIEFSELLCPLNKFLVAWFHVLASKFVT